MSRRRQLSDEERALWAGLTRSITPLRQRRHLERTQELNPVVSPSTAQSPGARAPSVTRPSSISTRDVAAPAPLGRRLKQRVARGRDPLDARIDLHGMTQTQAHAALLGFLYRAQAQGARTVLVITGKGSGKATTTANGGAATPGTLKRQVPMWLALPEFCRLVTAFDDAHPGHGGEGALYVRLRRPK